jgi:hypothetical protein
VLAARRSEDPNVGAAAGGGPPDDAAEVKLPAAFFMLLEAPLAWHHPTTSQLLHCGITWQTHRTAQLRGRSPRLVA